jgi:hypothetical protein
LGVFNCSSTGFFPLSHYFTDWRWFELAFALFPALLHLVKVIYLLNFCGGICFLASLLIEMMAPASSRLVPDYDLISISKDEYAQFLAYKQATSTSTSTATLVQSGIASHCLLSSTSNSWIIDFGANKHMTGSATSLFDYHLVDTPHSVTLANGSLSTVAGSGHTHLCPDIKLLSVLHVLGFPFNLLSISKITKALNCSISFYPSLCIFQDLKTQRMIGMGHEVDGLYYLDLARSVPPHALQSSTSALQWHCRLGHPSLPTLKHQVPSLSCEACQLSKHHRVSFPSSC